MGGQVVLLLVGFVLTSVVGGVLGSFFQRRTWNHQHKMQREDEERQQAIKTFEEVSSLLDKRLYRMRMTFWAARQRAAGSDKDELDAALNAYRETLVTWNDNLNRCLALIEAYFGAGVRSEMEEVYEEYASVGRALDQFVRDVSTGRETGTPPIGRRLQAVSGRVYRLNLRMLDLVKHRRLGESAPSRAVRPAASQRLLQFGDQGTDVRRLQKLLRGSGHLAAVADGLFGRDTERALRAFQESRGLDPDAIAGPRVWAALGKRESGDDPQGRGGGTEPDVGQEAHTTQ
jgi:tetratricopeptide (TPR) repeat protein